MHESLARDSDSSSSSAEDSLAIATACRFGCLLAGRLHLNYAHGFGRLNSEGRPAELEAEELLVGGLVHQHNPVRLV